MVWSPERVLLERDAALGALGLSLKGLQERRGGCLFLSGDAGLGKTALLDVVRRLAAETEEGVRVVRGRGSAMDVDVPFGLAAQVLEPLGRARLVEPGGAPGEARKAVMARAKRWVEAAAAGAPLVLLVDDVHWSDADSLDVISFVAHLIGGLPVVLVAALRPWPPDAGRAARRLVADGRAVLTTLAPLSRRASDEMLANRLRARPSEALATRAWAFAAGNPYLIEEVAGLVGTHGTLPDLGGDAGRLQDVLLLSRLASLPEPAIRCAQAAAVLGGEFRIALVAPVAGLDPEAGTDALDHLFRAGLVRETRPAWAAFAHALLGQAVYDDLLPGRRALLHRRAFELLAEMGKPSPAARHAVAADLLGDPRALAVVEAAGQALVSAGAVLAAADLLQSAIALAGAGAPASLHVLAGDAQLAAGRPKDAAANLRVALAADTLVEPTRVRVYRSLALADAYGGDLEGSAQVSGTALDLARRAVPEAVSGVLVDRVHAVWQVEGPRGALRLLDEVGRRSVSPTDAAFEAARLFITYCGTGDPDVLPQLQALARDPGDGPVSPFEPRLVYACVARWEERFDDDDRVLDMAESAAREQGVLRALFALALARADNRLLRGRPREALALLTTLEHDVPIEPLIAPAVAAGQATALCHLGRLDEAGARLDIGSSAAVMWQVDLALRSVRARLLFEEGKVTDACDGYREVEALVDRLGVQAPLVCAWASGAVAAYQAAHRQDDVVRVCDRLEAHGGVGEWARMVAGAGRAAVAAASGDGDRADAQYEDAVALGRAMPLERAGVLVAYGEWLRRSARPLQARRWFAEALQVAERAGAAGLAARAAAGLRAAGGRRSKRRSGPHQLSGQERRVAGLAAGGLTTGEIATRLFLSPKTVESHLGNVYAKLGVTSKRELRGRSFEEPRRGEPGATSL